MPISFYIYKAQLRNKKARDCDKGIRPSVVQFRADICMRLASILYFGRGPFFIPSPERIHIYILREHVLCFVSSKCFSFNNSFKR